MKIIVAVLSLALIGTFLFPIVFERQITASRMSTALDNCRSLHGVISMYLRDYEEKKGGQPSAIPSFLELEIDGYMDLGFLKKITQGPGAYVIYFSPKMKSSDVLIEYFYNGCVAVYRFGGDGEWLPVDTAEKLIKKARRDGMPTRY
jgi:hypothetical protein